MSTFYWKQYFENFVKVGLITKATPLEYFFALKAATVKLSKESLEDLGIMKL